MPNSMLKKENSDISAREMKDAFSDKAYEISKNLGKKLMSPGVNPIVRSYSRDVDEGRYTNSKELKKALENFEDDFLYEYHPEEYDKKEKAQIEKAKEKALKQKKPKEEKMPNNSMLKRDNYAEGGEPDENVSRIIYLNEQREKATTSEAKRNIDEELDSFPAKDHKAAQQHIDPEGNINEEIAGKKNKIKKAEGGSMLVAPEMGMALGEEEQSMPVDTFTPEEQANAESSQLPDDEMEEGYMDYVLGESLDDGEQEYLMGALESDPRLSEIFDKVVTTASEFSGAGEVEGPGTGVSDSIPARLSDGEFVVTEEATSEIGADNLQTMMDDAERKSSGGVTTRSPYQMGGLLGNPSQPLEEEDEDLVAQSMISANQMPSLMGGRR